MFLGKFGDDVKLVQWPFKVIPDISYYNEQYGMF